MDRAQIAKHQKADREAAARLLVQLIVERPAGPANRYRADPKAGTVVLDGTDLDVGCAPVETGHLAGTLGEDGRPLQAVAPVRLPTFAGCAIPVYAVGLVRVPDRHVPLVVTVPAVDPLLSQAQAFDALSDAARAAILDGAADARVADATAAEAVVRAAIEANRRARAAQQGRRTVPAWKVSDAVPPHIDGRQALPHTFAEQAVPLLPARFQEYIARALLPDERILMFVQRPATIKGGGLTRRRTRLREGIFVVTDRQVMFMVDSLDTGSTMVHWGYIARVGAVERVVAAAARSAGQLAVLDVTFAAARGAETVSVEFPAEFAETLDEAAALLRGFAPVADSRALRRRYPRAVPEDLPSLAEVRGRTGGSGAEPPSGGGPVAGIRRGPRPTRETGRVPQVQEEAPAWGRELLDREPLLVWAQAPAERGRAPRLAVGERSVVLDGADRGKAGPQRLRLDDVTSLEMALTLMASGIEVAAGDGEAVRRVRIRFHYPAAPPFLGAFTTIRHLMGLPPEEDGRGRNSPSRPSGLAP